MVNLEHIIKNWTKSSASLEIQEVQDKAQSFKLFIASNRHAESFVNLLKQPTKNVLKRV